MYEIEFRSQDIYIFVILVNPQNLRRHQRHNCKLEATTAIVSLEYLVVSNEIKSHIRANYRKHSQLILNSLMESQN